MANFKMQTFWEHDSGAGWSEVHWIAGSSYAEAVTFLDDYITARLATLPNNIILIYGKVHDVTKPYTVALTTKPLMAPGTYSVPTTDPVEHQIDECLLLREETSDNYYVNRYLHGIGTWATKGEEFVPHSTYNTALTALVNLFMNGHYYIRLQIGVTPVRFAVVSIARVIRPTCKQVGRPFGQSVGARRTHASVLTRAARKLQSYDHATIQALASGQMGRRSRSRGISAAQTSQ